MLFKYGIFLFFLRTLNSHTNYYRQEQMYQKRLCFITLMVYCFIMRLIFILLEEELARETRLTCSGPEYTYSRYQELMTP